MLSDPASAARVEANLTGYLDLIKDSNFNALFPNANDRPEDMLKRVALVGFFSRDNDFRRELYNAIEADVKDESAARVELRTRGQNPRSMSRSSAPGRPAPPCRPASPRSSRTTAQALA